MIVVKIYNKSETEINSSGGFTEDFRLFKAKYYSKMVNLLFTPASSITKSYVDSLVAPDFECKSAEFDAGHDVFTLYFERAFVNKSSQDATQTVATPTVSEKKTSAKELVESIEKVIEEEVTDTPEPVAEPEVTEEPKEEVKVKKPRARRRTKAEIEADRIAAAKRLVESL